MVKSISMAAITLFLLEMLMVSLEITGAQSVGVCYGTNGDNLPVAPDVVALYNSHNIGRMRIYEPNQQILGALKDSNIELILGVPNTDLQNLANDANAAYSWVQTNVRNYWPNVKFRYIAIGNEIAPGNDDTSQYLSYVLPAMQNINNALTSAGLHTQIKVSTATYNGVLGQSYPPSTGAFTDDVQTFLTPIISYLASIGSPILVNVYPYFAYTSTPNLKLSYALFTNPGPEFTDPNNNLVYQNLFDAIVDAMYAALEKAGGQNLAIVVSESGWPSAGNGAASTVDNAKTYNQNLINHVNNGTPKKPGALETYIFAMFNEDEKSPEVEKNFGLFLPNGQPVYEIKFS